MPNGLTLEQIEDLIGRDEAQLAAYRQAAADAEADAWTRAMRMAWHGSWRNV